MVLELKITLLHKYLDATVWYDQRLLSKEEYRIRIQESRPTVKSLDSNFVSNNDLHIALVSLVFLKNQPNYWKLWGQADWRFLTFYK
ncbi:hypothetical protein ACWGOQ_0016395 [Aquimarina sp. M1]